MTVGVDDIDVGQIDSGHQTSKTSFPANNGNVSIVDRINTGANRRSMLVYCFFVRASCDKGAVGDFVAP
jgi:hypothetical protein